MKKPPTTSALIGRDGATPLDMVLVAGSPPNTPAWRESVKRLRAWVKAVEALRVTGKKEATGGLFT